MKSFSLVVASFFFVLLPETSVASGPRTGFFLPDSVGEMTLHYRTVRGLVILPVIINDSVNVNLMLDTGCRNLILFGKKFTRLMRANVAREIEFSGLGDGRPVKGSLSLGNKVSINAVLGEQIPVVVVPDNGLFGYYHEVHGIIGYDIFVKFEVELNARAKTITFRPALKATAPHGFHRIPLDIVDARPVMRSQVYLNRRSPREFELMIDTGSSLGLLLKTTNVPDLVTPRKSKLLGMGLNGPVSGYQIVSNRLVLAGLEMDGISTGVISSPWHDNASIGMDILKHYIVVLNYCKAYACFKRHDS